MKNLKFLSIAALSLGLGLTSCSKDDGTPEEIHDHESIDEVVVKVTNLESNESATYNYRPDLDNSGIVVKENVPYNFTITELNSIDGEEVENIVDEIKEEKEAHFIVYNTNATISSFKRVDSAESTRANGDKVGLSVDVTFSKPLENGFFSFDIIHEPTSINPNGNNGLGAYEGGATDASVKYTLSVVK